jgi:antitoxin component of RelBE/YafQ-DinJ toxin-antitoxin module
MPVNKKENGNALLKQLGTNASAAINQLYEYVITQHRLPFARSKEGATAKGTYQEALTFIDSLPLPADNPFAQMDDAQIRRARLGL